MEFSTKRAKRVITAFINCVQNGEYTFEYASILIEDNQRYGYLTEADKEVFYAACEPVAVPEVIENTEQTK